MQPFGLSCRQRFLVTWSPLSYPNGTPDMVNVTTGRVALPQHERPSAPTTFIWGLQDVDCV